MSSATQTIQTFFPHCVFTIDSEIPVFATMLVTSRYLHRQIYPFICSFLFLQNFSCVFCNSGQHAVVAPLSAPTCIAFSQKVCHSSTAPTYCFFQNGDFLLFHHLFLTILFMSAYAITLLTSDSLKAYMIFASGLFGCLVC